MDGILLIRRLHQHRGWVNAKLLAAAAGLPHEKLHAPLSIGQGSLWKSLVHMHAAEYVWLEALLGNESPLLPGDLPGKLPGNQQGEGGIASFDELANHWKALEVRWQDYLAALTPEALDETVYKISTSSAHGQRRGTRRSDVLLHVCLHAHYTAAQTINMLRQLGAENLPDPMLITLARQEAPRGA